MTGFFITFEGGEGAGKSTQIRLLADTLRERGYEVLVTREPGGSPGAEAVRHVLLSGAAESFGPEMEALLFAAARADHVEQVIRPAVERGVTVLCDRFLDSTRVYQGVTGNLDPTFIAAVERVAINAMMPDLTIVLDLSPGKACAAPLPAEATSTRTASRRRRWTSTDAGGKPIWTSPSVSQAGASSSKGRQTRSASRSRSPRHSM